MINKGIFPTMLTPFNSEGRIDYLSLDRFIDKFETEGADGLFAVCQSSEMFDLSLSEKVDLAAYVSRKSKLQVIASGHTQKKQEDQLEAMRKMADTGVEAVVLISNAFAEEDEDDDVFIKNLESFLNNFKGNIPLGIYECPYPYKRLLSEKTLKYIIDTGRFVFLKDTSCDIPTMKTRLSIIGDSEFGLYNAHVETLTESMKMGAAGFSGIHANITIKLIKCLMQKSCENEKFTNNVQQFIEEFSIYLRNSYYPVSAKAMLCEMGIFETYYTRVKDHGLLTPDLINSGKMLLTKIKELEFEYNKKS